MQGQNPELGIKAHTILGFGFDLDHCESLLMDYPEAQGEFRPLT